MMSITLLSGQRSDKLTRLVPAFSCVFSDFAWLSQRISHSKLHFVNNGVAHDLSRKVGVRALTDTIEERLEKLANLEDVPSLRLALSPAVCAALQRLWNSVEFARGVLRLFEDNISRSKQYAQCQLIPAVESLHALMRSFTLQFVASIRTRLILMPERTDVTLDDGAHHSGSLAFVFIDYAAKTVYVNINQSRGNGSIRPTLILANALAQIRTKSIPGLDALRDLTHFNSLLDAGAFKSAQSHTQALAVVAAAGAVLDAGFFIRRSMQRAAQVRSLLPEVTRYTQYRVSPDAAGDGSADLQAASRLARASVPSGAPWFVYVGAATNTATGMPWCGDVDCACSRVNLLVHAAVQ